MKRKLFTLLMLLVSVFAVLAISNTKDVEAASISAGTKLYLTPNSNWKQSNARYAAYFFGNGEAWVSMTKVSGENDLYEVKSPDKAFTNVIFCRMNPNAAANNWNNKWNQTADLVYDGTNNHYTVKANTWDKGGGTWSIYPVPTVVIPHADLSLIFNPYKENGTYVRKTEININMEDEDVKKDLISAFHAQSIYTKRTTYFYPNELWMTNDEGTINSGYADNADGNMYNFSYKNGVKTINYVTNIKGTEDHYVTLNDINITEAQNWEVKDGVYTSKDADLIEQFLAFTAPCFLNVTEANKNVFTLSHVTIQEINNELVMKLYVGDDTKGFTGNGTNLLSTATITKSDSYTLAGTFNGWSTNKTYFKATDVAGYLYLELDFEAGNHEFKYVEKGNWRSLASGKISDTTLGTGWEFKNDGSLPNTVLEAKGGHYVFKLKTSTNEIEVYKI